MDKFIDGALLENLNPVTIVHGTGSGRLRESIRDYLREHRAVTGFEDGDLLRGGVGVTVVYLEWDEKEAVNRQPDDRSQYG